MRKAKANVQALRPKYPDVEVERIGYIGAGRRYFRWRNGRWSVKDHYDPSAADLAHWDSNT